MTKPKRYDVSSYMLIIRLHGVQVVGGSLIRREAALAHPCASRHRCFPAHCDFERPKDGPKGEGHTYRDVGGRATQRSDVSEQLPRMPGVNPLAPTIYFRS
jgi:hypothetical protein